MKSDECRFLAVEALEQMRGDDVHRARTRFRGMPPEQLNEPYGQSGKTCAQILAEYEAHSARIDAAIAWVRKCEELEHKFERTHAALMEWIDKTEWVQETSEVRDLGMHRADVMARRLKESQHRETKLRTANSELTAALYRLLHEDMQNDLTSACDQARDALGDWQPTDGSATRLFAFTFRGCEYTFDPVTKMVGGHMTYHVAHAPTEMVKFLASRFPSSA